MKFLITAALFVFFLFGFNTAYSKCLNYDPAKPIPKINVSYNGDNPNIKAGIEVARQVLTDRTKKIKFFTGICEAKDFTFTYESPNDISEWLFTTELDLAVRGYDGGADTPTMAYVTSEHPNTIFINVQKLDPRRPSRVANTIIHETIHNLDRKREDASFGHGNNSSAGKENSAPYWIGDWAQTVYENPNAKSSDPLFENEDPIIIEELNVTIDVSKVERWINGRPRPKPTTRPRSGSRSRPGRRSRS